MSRATLAGLFWFALACWAATMLWLSSLTAQELPDAAFLAWDKINHFLAYAVGGWLAAGALRLSRPSMPVATRIIGAIVIEPGALEAHKIMKTAGFWDIGIVNKRCIIGGQRLNLWGNVTRLFEHDQQLQGAHIVIGAISFLEIGKREFGVLINTC